MLPNCGVFPRETFAADAPSAAGKGLAIKCESKITSPAIETSGRSATRTALALAIAAEKNQTFRRTVPMILVLNTVNPPSRRETVDGLEHLIRRMNYARVRFIRALREDHLDEFTDNVHIGILEHALLDGS